MKGFFARHKRPLVFAVTLALLLSAIPLTKAAMAATTDFPYPSMLDYTELEASFNELARDCILPEYRDYVLEGIKYFIETKSLGSPFDSSEYRVARNLKRAFGANNDGNAVFFFDGCSINLQDSTPCFRGYMKDGKRYNMSAVCIVVQLNDKGHPQIYFATANSSTIADNVRKNENVTANLDISITRDGIYGIRTINHGSGSWPAYAALNINLGTVNESNPVKSSSVRMPLLTNTTKGSYYQSASGVDIHCRGKFYPSGEFFPVELGDTYRSSTGCFNIGQTWCDEDYVGFMDTIAGIDPRTTPFSSTASSKGYTNYQDAGVVIVDHTNYESQIAVIVGDDNPAAPDAKTGAEIARMIVQRADPWHEAIMKRVAAKQAAETTQPQTEPETHRPIEIETEPQFGPEYGPETEPQIESETFPPVGPQDEPIPESGPLDLVLMLDGSSSTSYRTFGIMKDLAVSVVHRAFAKEPELSVAVMVFGRSYTLEKLSPGDSGFYTAENDVLALLDNARMPGSITYLADSLLTVHNALAARNTGRSWVVMMSDGDANGVSSAVASFSSAGAYSYEANVAYNVAAYMKNADHCAFHTFGVNLFNTHGTEALLQGFAALGSGSYQEIAAAAEADLSFIQ